MVATGPWDPQVWTAGVELRATAVLDHWRVTPGFAELRMLEVPEEQTRVAMMETGQADNHRSVAQECEDSGRKGL